MKMFSLCFILIYFVFLCSIFTLFYFFFILFCFVLFSLLFFCFLCFILFYFIYSIFLYFILFFLFSFILFILFILFYFYWLVQVGQGGLLTGRFISSRIHPFPSEHGSKDAQSLLSTIMFTQMGTSGNLPFCFYFFLIFLLLFWF